MRRPQFAPRLALCVVAFALALSAAVASRPVTAAAAADKDFPVKFQRPSKAGEAYRLTVKSTQVIDRTMKAGDAPAQKQRALDAVVDLTGDLTVVAVDGRGRPTKVACKVGKLVVTPAGGQPAEPVKAGQTLAAEWNGKQKAVTLDGNPLPPDLAPLLQDLLTVDDPAKPDEDAQFGTRDRKKPGDKWDADAAAMRSAGEQAGVALKKDGVRGTVTFVEVRRAGGQDVGVFKVEVTAEVEPGGTPQGVPPQVKVRSGTLRNTSLSTFPLDPAGRYGHHVEDGTFEITMAGPVPNGPPNVELTMTVSRKKESTFEPAK